MGLSGSKPTPLKPEELTLINRKCQAFQKGLAGCRKANAAESATVCKNLEMRLLMCYAEDYCEAEATQHRKCYMKLYQTGIYNGKGNCIAYEEAMKKCLKMKSLYPA